MKQVVQQAQGPAGQPLDNGQTRQRNEHGFDTPINTAAKPSFTKRRRLRSTVATETSTAVALDR